MKRVQIVLLGLLMFLGVTANAQQRNEVGPGARQRMNELQLTAEQKRRIAIIIRRQRMQNIINQRELNEILTDKQKALLQDWRKRRNSSYSDSSVKRQ